MEDHLLNDQVAELDRGAPLYLAATSDKESLAAAGILSSVGLDLVDAGGMALLVKAHSMVDPRNQRTVEVKWYGFTGKGGKQWFP